MAISMVELMMMLHMYVLNFYRNVSVDVHGDVEVSVSDELPNYHGVGHAIFDDVHEKLHNYVLQDRS